MKNNNLTFDQLVARERSYVQEGFREFFERFQSESQSLGISEEGRVLDPHVERLVDAFSFLAARLHDQMRVTRDDIAHHATSMMYPVMTRFTPSALVAQVCTEEAVGCGHIFHKNSVIEVETDDDVTHIFQTIGDVTYWPVHLKSVELMVTSGGIFHAFYFTCAEDDWPQVQQMTELMLYSHHQDALLSAWIAGVFTHTSQPIFVVDEHQMHVGEGTLEMAMIDETFLHFCDQGPLMQLMIEYILFESKKRFWRFRVKGLEKISSGVFAIHVPIKSGWEAPLLDAASWHLHCVPMINVFSAVSYPIVIDGQHGEYALHTTQNDRADAYEHYIYDVEGLYDAQSGERIAGVRDIAPHTSCMYDWRYDQQYRVFVVFEGAPEDIYGRTYYARMLCSDRRAARALRCGMKMRASSNQDIIWKVIGDCSAMWMPRMQDFCWDFVKQLSLDHQRGFSFEALHKSLAMCSNVFGDIKPLLECILNIQAHDQVRVWRKNIALEKVFKVVVRKRSLLTPYPSFFYGFLLVLCRVLEHMTPINMLTFCMVYDEADVLLLTHESA